MMTLAVKKAGEVLKSKFFAPITHVMAGAPADNAEADTNTNAITHTLRREANWEKEGCLKT